MGTLTGTVRSQLRFLPEAVVAHLSRVLGYAIEGACTNAAESYFSRLRRAELGHHHHIAGPYLVRYAREAAWRQDLRRVSNGEQTHAVVREAMVCPPSVDFCGYWQRAHAA
jgi:hypothetical protein